MATDHTAWARENVTGFWTTLWTPFDEDEAFDEAGQRENVRRILKMDTDGLAVNWGAGEFWSLSIEERKQNAEVLVDEVDGDAFTGTQVGGLNSVRQAVELARHAEATGVDVVIINGPAGSPSWDRSDEALFDYIETIADSVDLPVQFTNWPGCGKLLSSDAIADFTEKIDNLAIIKEAHSDNARAVNTFQLVGDNAVVSQPKDGFFMHALFHGIEPQVYFANPADALFDSPTDAPFRDFVDAAIAGDVETAIEAYTERLAAPRELFKEVRIRHTAAHPHVFALPIVLKPWVEIRGFAAGDVRSPLPSLPAEEVEYLRENLERLGLANDFVTATA